MSAKRPESRFPPSPKTERVNDIGSWELFFLREAFFINRFHQHKHICHPPPTLISFGPNFIYRNIPRIPKTPINLALEPNSNQPVDVFPFLKHSHKSYIFFPFLVRIVTRPFQLCVGGAGGADMFLFQCQKADDEWKGRKEKRPRSFHFSFTLFLFVTLLVARSTQHQQPVT